VYVDTEEEEETADATLKDLNLQCVAVRGSDAAPVREICALS
jgi:hypothetical protein